MTPGPVAPDKLKSAIYLSVDYYSKLFRISTDYWKSLGSLAKRAAPPPPASTSTQVPRPPLLLMGTLGEEARASFLVQNSLPDTVTARVTVRGAGPAAAVRVDPQEKVLAPGEQCVVEALVRVSKDMKIGEDYSGELAIPELASRGISYVIRRVAAARDSK